MEHILKESITDISEDTKLIRLATITTFVHSLLFILYLIYLVFQLASLAQGSDNKLIIAIQEYGVQIAENPSLIIALIIIGIIGVIGYYLLPPIGESSMIYYLDSPHRGGTASLGKGINRFFPMFEFDATMSFFNLLVFLILTSRMRAMGILRQPLVLMVVILWLFIILIASLLLPYTRILITLEKMKFFDAMRKSVKLSIRHFVITFRYVVITYILYARFVLNIIIVIGIPLVLTYFALSLGILHHRLIHTIGIILVIGLILITAYINGIIEAFFMTYRYKVYSKIKHDQQVEDDGDED